VSNDYLPAAFGQCEPIADSVAGEGGPEFGSALGETGPALLDLR
jgi:hypothetical protein